MSRNTNASDFILKMKQSNARLFGAARITIAPDELTKLVRGAWEDGFRNGTNAGKSLFEQLFGTRK